MRAGKDRGKTGVVLRAMPKDEKIFIDGLQLVSKHVRPKTTGQKGETVKIPQAVPVSKVMLFCASCRRGVRAGYRLDGGNKVRVCRRCSTEV